MLKHKHFDLQPGEVLLVTKNQEGYDVSVTKHDALELDYKPCMWIYAGVWQGFGYAKGHLGSDERPNIPEGDFNLGMRWLNSSGNEFTSEERRVQWVRPEVPEGETIVTYFNWRDARADTTECSGHNVECVVSM